MSSESRTYKHTYVGLISYNDMISDNKHGGFSKRRKRWLTQCFPGLTQFSEAHSQYTIDTWYDQIIQFTVG